MSRSSVPPATASGIALPVLGAGEDAPGKVMLVDDNPVGARAVTRMIEASSHQVVAVNDWASALRCFAQEDVDLVLMDAVMPDVDGFKLTRTLRGLATSYVPIVFITATADARSRERAIEVGADDLLAKPVDAHELRLRLVAMLRLRRLTRALEDLGREQARLARVDALTGLLNRRVLDEHLTAEVRRARRYRRDLSLLMLDVDHFKAVNDTHGHEAGDRILATLGEILGEQTRGADRAYRYGGEEFAVLVPETSGTDALTLAERLRRTFARTTATGSGAGPQTLSVGLATLRDIPHDAEPHALLREADAALYAAKAGGRDRVAVRERTAAPGDDRQGPSPEGSGRGPQTGSPRR